MAVARAAAEACDISVCRRNEIRSAAFTALQADGFSVEQGVWGGLTVLVLAHDTSLKQRIRFFVLFSFPHLLVQMDLWIAREFAKNGRPLAGARTLPRHTVATA